MKRFCLTTVPAAEQDNESCFTLQEEKDDGGLTEEQITSLDSIQIGETWQHPTNPDVQYLRLSDVADEVQQIEKAA